jgi:hypothetical protein
VLEAPDHPKKTALVRYTGYTAQSRGRHATHTWNVTRLPEIDHGGVLADQRTPEREVLDALRRQPDTGFAVHDAPPLLEQLLAEQAELRELLEQAPPDRRPALRKAEHALVSAERDFNGAHHRLQAAQERLAELGSLSQLRPRGRAEKASLLDQIDLHVSDIRRADARVATSRRDLEHLRLEANQRQQWDAAHDWPATRLSKIDAELARATPQGREIGSGILNHALPDHGLRQEQHWLERLADLSRPHPPGRDPGHGIDLGL